MTGWTLEKDLSATEFVVLAVFGGTGQPEYQIEIHIRRPDALTLDATWQSETGRPLTPYNR